jgi:hypothetical protein
MVISWPTQVPTQQRDKLRFDSPSRQIVRTFYRRAMKYRTCNGRNHPLREFDVPKMRRGFRKEPPEIFDPAGQRHRRALYARSRC